MTNLKVTLEDLVKEGDEVILDIENEIQNPVYNLINEEITAFIEKPKEEKHDERKENFFATIPESELKKTMDKILKNRNQEEERARKYFQFEFDRKMNRINKIKSKEYRKMKRREKIRKEEELRALLTDSENEANTSESNDQSSTEEVVEQAQPIISELRRKNILAAILTTKQEEVRSVFEEEEAGINEEDFVEEKEGAVTADAPKIEETVLFGWGDWAGEGVIHSKTHTTYKVQEGVRSSDRKDFGKSHIIINENIKIPEKYKSELPYGYTESSYKEKLKTPISAETTSLRVFNKFVKINGNAKNVSGKSIKPSVFDPEY